MRRAGVHLQGSTSPTLHLAEHQRCIRKTIKQPLVHYPFLHSSGNECVFSFYYNFNLVDGRGALFLPGARIFPACQGRIFQPAFCNPPSVKYRPAKQNTDPIGYHFDNFGWISSAGLHSRCVESWQTNYGLDFLFHISQLWFQNLLALVTRYQEFTFCLRFAVCMHSWIVEIWVCQT